MHEVFVAKPHQYIAENNPDILITLQQESNVNGFLELKVAAIATMLDELLAANLPAYLIEERCMDELTKDLRPSRFYYLVSVLEEEFEREYYQLKEKGLLTYEVINLIESRTPILEALGFTEENENDRHLRYAITGAVNEYFENKQ